MVKVSEGLVQKVQDHGSSRADTRLVCWHCGKRGHLAEHCRFKMNRCHKNGHIKTKCKERQDKEELKLVDKQGEDESRDHGYHVIDTLCVGTIG